MKREYKQAEMERRKAQGFALPSTTSGEQEGQPHTWCVTLRAFTEPFGTQEYLEARVSPCRTWLALLTLRRRLRLCSLPGSEGNVKFLEIEVEDVQHCEWFGPLKGTDLMVLVLITSAGDIKFCQFANNRHRYLFTSTEQPYELQVDQARSGRLAFPLYDVSKESGQVVVSTISLSSFLLIVNSKRGAPAVEEQGIDFMGRGNPEGIVVLLLNSTVIVAIVDVNKDTQQIEIQLQRRFNLRFGRDDRDVAGMYTSFCCEKGWLFALRPSGHVDIWNTVLGVKYSPIDVVALWNLQNKPSAHHMVGKSSATTQGEMQLLQFERLAISKDLLWLAIIDAKSTVVLVSLDAFFSLLPVTGRSIPSAVEYLSSGRLSVGLSTVPFPPASISPRPPSSPMAHKEHEPSDSGCMGSQQPNVHWFEVADTQQEGSCVQLLKGRSPWKISISALPKVEEGLTVNGFTLRHTSKPSGRSLSMTSLPTAEINEKTDPTAPSHVVAYSPLRPSRTPESSAPYSQSNADDDVLAPSPSVYIIPSCYPQGKLLDTSLTSSSLLFRFAVPDLPHPITVLHHHPVLNLPGIAFEQRDPSLVLLLEDGSWHYLTSEGLESVVIGHTREQLLHNLIMFESTSLADRLCTLNTWENRSLHIHALELGLKYRQLNVVESALQSLEEDQQLQGSEMLLTYVQTCSPTTDKDFIRSLLHIGMLHISTIIRELSASVGTGQVNTHLSATEVPRKKPRQLDAANVEDGTQDDATSRLYRFAATLESLRTCQSTLVNTSSHGPDTSSAPGLQENERKGRLARSLFPSILENSDDLEVTNDKVVDNGRDEDLALFSTAVIERWDAMMPAEVVRDALLSGALSTAICYLRYRGIKANLRSTQRSRSNVTGDLFGYVRDISHALAYQAVCQDQIDLAVRILRAIGHRRIALHLRQIASLTCRSSVRARLLSLLEAESASIDTLREVEPLSFPIDAGVLAYMRQIERLYPNPYYSLERIKRLSSSHKTMQQLAFGDAATQKLDMPLWWQGTNDDLDDLIPATAGHHGFRLVASVTTEGEREDPSVKGSIPIHPITDSSYWPLGEESPHAGYAQLTLASVAMWTATTRLRVLLEKEIDPASPLPLPLSPPGSMPTVLTYLMAHNHLHCLLSTLRAICSSYQTLRPEVLRSLAAALPVSPDYLKAAIFSELGRGGLFIGAGAAEGSTQWYHGLLNQLCSLHRLLAARDRTDSPIQYRSDSVEYRHETDDMYDRLLPKGAVSVFHQSFMKWCIDNQLSSVLLRYMSSHQLAFTSTALRELLPSFPDNSWPALLFLVRLQENMADASLTNAALCYKKKIFNVQDLLHIEGAIGLAIALVTLGYAGIRLQDALEGVHVEEKWRIDRAQIAATSESFASLREALLPSGDATQSMEDNGMLGDIPSARGDISLLELVQEGHPIDIMAVISGRGNEERDNEMSLAETPGLLGSSCVEHRLPKWEYMNGHRPRTETASLRKDIKGVPRVNQGGIDVWYYLVAARPFQAFHMLMRLGPAQAMPPPSHVPHLEALLPALPQTLLSRPLQHRSQPTLTTAEIAYFQRYARLVALEHVQETEVSGACCCFLQQLGIDSQLLALDIEAARRILTQHPSPPSVSQLVPMFLEFPSSTDPAAAASASAKVLRLLEEATRNVMKGRVIKDRNAPWRIVGMFSKAHGHGLPPWHLEQLASDGDWIGFLHEASSQGFPAALVLSTIAHFKDRHLRGHLSVVLSALLSSESPARDDQDQSSMWGTLLSSFSSNQPSMELLQKALYFHRPLFAIVASCFDGIEPLRPLLAWLLSSRPVSDIEDNKREASEILKSIASSNINSWGMEELSRTICALCEKGMHLLVQKAFLLFDPGSLFVEFMLFYQAYLQRRFSDCGPHLKLFASNLDSPSERGNIMSHEWQRRTGLQLLEGLLWGATSGYEQGVLLRVTHEAALSETYSRLHATFQLLARTGLGRDQLAASPATVLDVLLTHAHFEEARSFAMNSSMHHLLDDIALREAQYLLSRSRTACLWSVEQERINIWKQIDSIFKKTNCKPERAGQFFLSQVGQDGQSAREQLLLLTSAQAHFLSAGAGLVASIGVDMVDLENRILLLSVSTEAATLQSAVPITSASPSLHISGLPTSSFSPQVLLQIVNRLLQNGDIAKAERICQQFKVENREVLVLRYMSAIAQDKMNIEDLPTWVTGDIENESRGAILEQLLGKVEHALEYAGALVVRYKVGQRLSLPFDEVASRDPYQLLMFLLMNGKDMFPLTDAFIQYNHLNYSKVAIHIAESFYKALQAQNEQQPPSGIDPAWSDEDFAQFINLSKAPKEVGNRLVYLLSKNKEVIPAPMEVELLVRAHYCFRLACSLSGCDMVQHMVKDRLPQYIRNRQFRLLLRLLTGIKAYNELTYIFDALLQNEQFEIMLGKVPGMQNNSVDQMEFRLALHRYLVTYHPEDTEKLTMMFLAFNMHREMGAFLKQQALDILEAVKFQPNGSQSYQKLVKAMGLLLDAADSFVKDRSFGTGNWCLAQANLISLQVEMGDNCLLGLDQVAARRAMTSLPTFASALIVARAYNLNSLSEWIGPLYQQVIAGGNFAYLDDFLQAVPTSQSLYTEMAQKYQGDTNKASRAPAFKRFLRTCGDSFVGYDIAKELSMDDVLAELPVNLIQQWKVPSSRH